MAGNAPGAPHDPQKAGQPWRVGLPVVRGPEHAKAAEAHALRRRQLLRRGFWAGMGVLAAGGLAGLAEFLNPTVPQRFGGTITVPADKVPRPGDEPYHDIAGRFWLVNLKPGEGGVPAGVEVMAGASERAPAPSRMGGLLALYQKCTHHGCTVFWRSDFDFAGARSWFRCPCCGGTYTKAGVRIFGPPPRSMDTFRIREISSLGVRVDTGHVILGALDDPQRTVSAGPFGD